MQNRTRHSVIAIPLPGTQAVATEVGGWEATFKGRLLEAELFIKTKGTVSGSTDVDVNKAGATVLAAPLSIAFDATDKRVRAKPTVGIGGHPNGVDFIEGDYFSVDVDAIPGGSDSADAVLYLHVAALDS